MNTSLRKPHVLLQLEPGGFRFGVWHLFITLVQTTGPDQPRPEKEMTLVVDPV